MFKVLVQGSESKCLKFRQYQEDSSIMPSPPVGQLDPQMRLSKLTVQGNAVDVDGNIPLRRYFRSGLEMVRMANMYYEEGSLEDAFILYMKFMTLFIEKIRSHPEFRTHSSIEKTNNTKKLKEVLPRAESLKETLQERYRKEHNAFLEQKRKEQQLLKEQEELIRKQKFEEQMIAEQRAPPGYEDEQGWSNAAKQVWEPTPPMFGAPHIDRNTKPLSLLSTVGGSKSGLRSVVVPVELMNKFMTLAHSNTQRNIETCGILAGKVAQNTLLITHLLVPEQCGTSDSCTTQHEEKLFDYQDQHDLITLGWIHTHPTQTAFLSSVDLHTHCSYQLMMPEALAIVCAPKYEEIGYFTLTPNHGLSYIANCRESGFHPHPKEPPLFQTADHITLDKSLVVKVVDMRL
ncbi:STAM-binding protein-like A isoform X3 [Oratosquilla oratoria]|uniref:STAM-binding protein-like A isoform X3 n=1 Tax=Oratosquilla oratoria TaxID=337810 RepID=UPI003F764979